ncbi:MAG: xanthine dehydrogenase accessory protein XdhC, partial [Geminicoccaceae bacterium]
LGQCCGGMVRLLFERISTPTPAWIERLQRRRNDHGKAVLIYGTDAALPGKMIVTDHGYEGGLGDSVLEREAMDVARRLLGNAATPELRSFKMRSRMSAHLLFEPIRTSDFHILLFGAGHVGKALVQVLQGLPCSITWVDPRENEFPDILPANVSIDAGDRPDLAVDVAPPGSYVLIMTHSHALDLVICERALQCDDLAFCGLIGSATKLAKFRRRLTALGLSAAALNGLTCPIGIDGISGKHPSEIAVAVAAQLLQRREGRSTPGGLRAGHRSSEPAIADDRSLQ